MPSSAMPANLGAFCSTVRSWMNESNTSEKQQSHTSSVSAGFPWMFSWAWMSFWFLKLRPDTKPKSRIWVHAMSGFISFHLLFHQVPSSYGAKDGWNHLYFGLQIACRYEDRRPSGCEPRGYQVVFFWAHDDWRSSLPIFWVWKWAQKIADWLTWKPICMEMIIVYDYYFTINILRCPIFSQTHK